MTLEMSCSKSSPTSVLLASSPACLLLWPPGRCAPALSVSIHSPLMGFDYTGLLRLLALDSHETTWSIDVLLKSGQKAAL